MGTTAHQGVASAREWGSEKVREATPQEQWPGGRATAPVLRSKSQSTEGCAEGWPGVGSPVAVVPRGRSSLQKGAWNRGQP